MTQLFLIHSPQDAATGLQLRHALADRGYVIWADPSGSPHGREQVWQAGVRDSQSILVVWSATAAQAQPVITQIEHAQWLHKPLVVLALDGTSFPQALAKAPLVHSRAPFPDAVAHLLAHLPPGASNNASPKPSAPFGTAIKAQNAAVNHIFGVRCAKGHVTYFDKQVVCRAGGTIVRLTELRDGKNFDALRLRCGTSGCSEWVVVEVDCEGYR
ncbi:toll/interleukin-1 receptor domain-containing protein [Candidatus Chloroploca sp. M-50]|uniref:Toll/interleukin-1 receptor domain-containing protein n=1 Tax=Candidatus Chloroploca mongolica TaxID=2528176 RepID=A0ABS4DG56_9CHLR|nr:hypothetical protein [Candidatus Chloroploca mongolica]MBP1466202.1 toll/interleukin-1 receptor domain-containing protein [Candidatus Chloroploca mongolica]MBP1468427.1 toll/interleukin-1 receptor domain-containing protein [Candidatus Chloroploca mongolica]